jgi:anhydro-N-acetylmuramic acid kinase
MSGTSADAMDAALVRIGTSVSELSLVAFRSVPLPQSLRERIHELAQVPVPLRDFARIDVEIGERFADAALAVVCDGGVTPEDIAGIGSHGQTVGHFPEPDVRGSLQLGAPAVIHERTGIPVIADFRAADLAAGGQGAPLTAFFHHVYFAERNERRAVLNIGGFTNVSYLPGLDREGVIAFDPGPGNALIDRAARWASAGAESFDRDGAQARQGQADPEVVADLLSDAYFAMPPPKSTGHEHFGQAFFERSRDRVLARGGTPNDVLATLTHVTVESIADQAERFFPAPPERWIVYGGGVWNSALWEALGTRLAPAPMERTEVYGLPVDALEAVTFAVLGWCASRGEPCNLPGTTGARHPVILGAATPPARGGGRWLRS